MITHIKVLFVLLYVTWGSQGDRINHRRWAWEGPEPDNNVGILFPGSTSNRANGPPPVPAHHPQPNIPGESERIEMPVAPRPTLSPKPVTSLPRRLAPKPACANECDAPCGSDDEYNSTVRARIDTLINENGGINTILKDPVLKTLLKEVVIPEEEAPSVRGGVIESPVCAGEELIFFPERAKTANGDWAFILNQGSVVQGIKYEKCIQQGTKCRLGAAGSEIDTVCRQKYIYKKMLVMDGQGSKILPEDVYMPSCCICYVVKPFNGFGRFGPKDTHDGCH